MASGTFRNFLFSHRFFCPVVGLRVDRRAAASSGGFRLFSFAVVVNRKPRKFRYNAESFDFAAFFAALSFSAPSALSQAFAKINDYLVFLRLSVLLPVLRRATIKCAFAHLERKLLLTKNQVSN